MRRKKTNKNSNLVRPHPPPRPTRYLRHAPRAHEDTRRAPRQLAPTGVRAHLAVTWEAERGTTRVRVARWPRTLFYRGYKYRPHPLLASHPPPPPLSSSLDFSKKEAVVTLTDRSLARGRRRGGDTHHHPDQKRGARKKNLRKKNIKRIASHRTASHEEEEESAVGNPSQSRRRRRGRRRRRRGTGPDLAAPPPIAWYGDPPLPLTPPLLPTNPRTTNGERIEP